jgi:hypothetical protein
MIYILIRKTTDWEDEAAFHNQLSDEFRPKVDMWNRTFHMPYHMFRARVKHIAQINLRNIENAICAPREEIPQEAVVVPVDDDDWFSPELGGVLESSFRENQTGAVWQRNILELPPGPVRKLARLVWYGLFGRERRVWTCSTNNYAVVKKDRMVPLAYDHVKASEHFDGRPQSIVKIDKALSLMNRTLASQTTMAWKRPGISSHELTRKHARYRRLYVGFNSPDLAWSLPYVKMMADLMAELRLK